MITFLIFANLYMWLWDTFDAKAQGEVYIIRKEYYGAKVRIRVIFEDIAFYSKQIEIIWHVYVINL